MSNSVNVFFVVFFIFMLREDGFGASNTGKDVKWEIFFHPPSSRDEGLRLLHGLETSLATSLQTPQEA